MADGYAVKELLKIANLLHRATIPQKIQQDLVTIGDLNDQISTIKLVRSIASNLTEIGAELYQCLAKEENLRVSFVTLSTLKHNLTIECKKSSNIKASRFKVCRE